MLKSILGAATAVLMTTTAMAADGRQVRQEL